MPIFRVPKEERSGERRKKANLVPKSEKEEGKSSPFRGPERNYLQSSFPRLGAGRFLETIQAQSVIKC